MSVPNNRSFTLRNVTSEVGGTALRSAFSNSVDSLFDSMYKGNKDRLSNFQNYGAGGGGTISIGDLYGGGIVGYIFVSGDPGYVAGETHGIIVSGDLGSFAWALSNYVYINANTAIGQSYNNTSLIIAHHGVGDYAAYICRSYTGGGYSDWSLPTDSEMLKLRDNRLVIGFQADWYWTSVEWNSYHPSDARSIAMVTNGAFAFNPKDAEFLVRAIRYF